MQKMTQQKKLFKSDQLPVTQTIDEGSKNIGGKVNSSNGGQKPKQKWNLLICFLEFNQGKARI